MAKDRQRQCTGAKRSVARGGSYASRRIGTTCRTRDRWRRGTPRASTRGTASVPASNPCGARAAHAVTRWLARARPARRSKRAQGARALTRSSGASATRPVRGVARVRRTAGRGAQRGGRALRLTCVPNTISAGHLECEGKRGLATIEGALITPLAKGGPWWARGSWRRPNLALLHSRVQGEGAQRCSGGSGVRSSTMCRSAS